VFAWVQTLRALEFEPRAVQAAQQTASLVNLSRAALRQADGINRVALVKSLGSQEAMRVAPREPGDRWEPFEVDRFTRRVGRNCAPRWARRRRRAQRQRPPGMWVGFTIERDPTGCRPKPATPLSTTAPGSSGSGIALLATLLGSVGVASLINRPLRSCRLPPAASAVATSTHAWTRTR
jgi:two-component system osmolarity sensor histidine kinase EnvZ